MKNDQFFHKRKASKKWLKRHEGVQEENKRYLIACEGIKTEPIYFKALKSHLNLPNVEIKIISDCGSAPKSIYDAAKKLVKEESGSSAAYNAAFCVFDRDTHESFDKTCDDIKNQNKNNKKCIFYAITSTPCFEVWFMLHFGYNSGPIESHGCQSCGQVAKIRMKKYAGFKNYDGVLNAGQLDLLMKNMDTALKNAERLEKENSTTKSKNPSTNVHILINEIRKNQINNN